MNKLKAIVFDAYGTLFNIASIDHLLEKHFGEHASAVAAVWRRKQLEYTWLRTMMNRYKNFYELTKDALVYACAQTGVKCSAVVAEELMDHYYELSIYAEVAEALGQLKEKYKLAILSNANPELLEKAVAHNQIQDRFDAIFSVDPLRQFKPIPSVYQLPVSHWEVSKDEILFVSSNTWDVAGAKSFGLSVAWIMRNNSLEENLGFSADLKVKDVQDLAHQLII